MINSLTLQVILLHWSCHLQPTTTTQLRQHWHSIVLQYIHLYSDTPNTHPFTHQNTGRWVYRFWQLARLCHVLHTWQPLWLLLTDFHHANVPTKWWDPKKFAPAPTHTSTHPHKKKINSFVLWMEGWNVYAGTILSAKLSQALEFFGYQQIITSLSLSLPLSVCMTYDTYKIPSTGSQPLLPTLGCTPPGHMDRLHTNAKAQPERWPYPHCSSMYHFPDRCPFRINVPTNPDSQQLPAIRTTNTPNTTFNSSCPQSLPRDFNIHTCPRPNCAFCTVCKDNTPNVLAPHPTFGVAHYPL